MLCCLGTARVADARCDAVYPAVPNVEVAFDFSYVVKLPSGQARAHARAAVTAVPRRPF